MTSATFLHLVKSSKKCRAVRWVWAPGRRSTARGQHALEPYSLFWILCCFISELHVKSLILGLASSITAGRCQNKQVRGRNQGPAEQLGPELPRLQLLERWMPFWSTVLDVARQPFHYTVSAKPTV